MSCRVDWITSVMSWNWSECKGKPSCFQKFTFTSFKRVWSRVLRTTLWTKQKLSASKSLERSVSRPTLSTFYWISLIQKKTSLITWFSMRLLVVRKLEMTATLVAQPIMMTKSANMKRTGITMGAENRSKFKGRTPPYKMTTLERLRFLFCKEWPIIRPTIGWWRTNLWSFQRFKLNCLFRVQTVG